MNLIISIKPQFVEKILLVKLVDLICNRDMFD